MAYYSGLYLHYEGSDAQASGTQQQRELTFTSDLERLRYYGLSGLYYFYNTDQIDVLLSGVTVGSGTLNYLSLWTASGTLTDSPLWISGNHLMMDSNKYIHFQDIILAGDHSKLEFHSVASWDSGGTTPVAWIDNNGHCDFSSGNFYNVVIEAEYPDTSGIETLLTLRRLTSGTAAAGLGSKISFVSENHYGSISEIASIIASNYSALADGSLDLYASNMRHIKMQGGITTIGNVDGNNSVQLNWYGPPTCAGTAMPTRTIAIPCSELAIGYISPDPVLTGYFRGMSYDIGDDSIFTVKVPNEAYSDPDTQVNLEVSVLWYAAEPYSLASGEVQWQIEWGSNFCQANVAIDAPAYSGLFKSGDQPIAGLSKAVTSTLIGTASGIIYNQDIVGFKLSRVALDSGTDPIPDPVVVGVLVQYVADKL